MQEGEGGGERDCGRATVLLCLPAGLIWSPVRPSLLKSLLSLLPHYNSLFGTASWESSRGTPSSSSTQTNDAPVKSHQTSLRSQITERSYTTDYFSALWSQTLTNGSLEQILLPVMIRTIITVLMRIKNTSDESKAKSENN